MNLRASDILGRVVVAGSLLFAWGCSGDDGGASDDGNGGTSTGGTSGSAQGGVSGGGGTPPLFTSAPDCDSNVERLEGTFQGAAVNYNQSVGPTTLTGRSYYTVSTGKSRVRLQWGATIAPNVVQP